MTRARKKDERDRETSLRAGVRIAPCQESADLNRYARDKARVAHPRARNPVSYGPRIRVISQDLLAREINDVRHRRMTQSGHRDSVLVGFSSHRKESPGYNLARLINRQKEIYKTFRILKLIIFRQALVKNNIYIYFFFLCSFTQCVRLIILLLN